MGENLGSHHMVLAKLNSQIALSLDGQDSRSYRELQPEEYEEAIKRTLDYLAGDVEPSGSGYLSKWEAGWGENLAELRSVADPSEITDALTPKFVRKNLPAKVQGRWVMPKTENFEMSWVSALRESLARTYFSDISALYEFGAGTGHNLLHFAELLPGVELRGFDWSTNSVELQNELARKAGIPLKGRFIDLFSPSEFRLEHSPESSALITMGTVEQLGKNFKPCLDVILASRFKYVVHMETAYELYDPRNLVDYLSIKYLEKRDWAQGYFSELQRLERDGSVEIVEQARTFGSFFHEGYTVTIWRPTQT